MKKRSYTRTAFLYLLVPLIHLAVSFVFGFLAYLTELSANRGGIYVVFSAIATILLMLFPLMQTASSLASFIFQIKALGNKESKVKTIIMMVVSTVYLIAAILLFRQLWLGILSV